MSYVIGVILFALCILISVSLHEAGHMGTAKLFGMRVTRYFIGFGPTIWSFRRGETEYGFKWLPFGGFVKITGMTEQEEDEEEVPPEDMHRVFWRKPLWQRTLVLAAGSVTHFVLGFLILWILVAFVAAPNPAYAQEVSTSTAVVVSPCLTQPDPAECTDADEPSPAAAAGLRDGDRVVAVNGKQIAGERCLLPDAISGTEPTSWTCAVLAIRALPADQPADLVIERDGESMTIPVTPHTVEIPTSDGGVQKLNQIGIAQQAPVGVAATITYGPVEGVGAAVDLTGDMAVRMAEAVTRIPEKVPALWNAIIGEERDAETPVSVVGASRLGGEMVENEAWASFFLLLATLNYFIGLFNLVPLLPMDGGHIAIAWYERVRSWWAAKRRRPDPGRVDYLKLMPLTYTVLIIMVGFTLLTVTADIVNPITIFK